MTLHLFRIKPDNDTDPYLLEYSSEQSRLDSTYPLYAFTDEQKLAERFMIERDMKKFIYIKVKKQGDDAVQWMHHHRGLWLSIYKMETYTNKYTDKQRLQYAKLLATENEYSYVDEAVDISAANILGQNFVFVETDIFDNELKKMLDILGYSKLFNMYKSMHIDYDENDVDEGCMYDPSEGFIWTSGLSADQLGMFIVIYGSMLTPSFYDHLKFVKKED